MSLFTFRAKLLSGVLERVDGTVTPWKLGGVIIKGSATKSDALVLTSPDEHASLKVGSRTIVDPFRDGPTYAIPIATLDGGDIVHVSEAGAPTLIATVESASMPSNIAIRTWIGGSRISLEMPFNVGGVMVELQSETGGQELSEVSFDHLPAAQPRRAWLLNAEADRRKITVEINGTAFAGLSLITVKARLFGEEDWSQLSNPETTYTVSHSLHVGRPNRAHLLYPSSRPGSPDGYAPELGRGPGKALQQRWSALVPCPGLRPAWWHRATALAVFEGR